MQKGYLKAGEIQCLKHKDQGCDEPLNSGNDYKSLFMFWLGIHRRSVTVAWHLRYMLRMNKSLSLRPKPVNSPMLTVAFIPYRILKIKFPLFCVRVNTEYNYSNRRCTIFLGSVVSTKSSLVTLLQSHFMGLFQLVQVRISLRRKSMIGKTNRSIDDNRLIIVNWHRLASANRWSIDNHTVVANFIDCQPLALISCLGIFRYRASARRSYIFFKPQLQSLRIVHRCGSAKTAQIIKTSNISRCQKYKLDRFSFEFIAKIQLTWDTVVVQTRLSLLLFLLFFYFLSMHVQTPTSTSIFRVEFPRVIYGVAKSYSRRASNVVRNKMSRIKENVCINWTYFTST